jgi:hypothetical protein
MSVASCTDHIIIFTYSLNQIKTDEEFRNVLKKMKLI